MLIVVCADFVFGQTPKKLAPGVMRTIRPFVNYSETYQWSSMPEIVGRNSSYEWARDLFFNKEVWCLEFSFKPVRMMEVEFPTSGGRLERKLVWYMVYSVTNTGKTLKNEIEVNGDTTVNVMVGTGSGKLEKKTFENISNNIDGTYRPVTIDYMGAQPDAGGKVAGTRRFTPQFVLASPEVVDRNEYADTDMKNGLKLRMSQPAATNDVVYYDEFLPLAFARIAAKEDPNQKFYTSITISSVDIKPGDTVWGIATWLDVDRSGEHNKLESVDPRIDRFSVYVSGLTNALRWEDSPAAYDPKATPLQGRAIARKVLRLNFYRPGDEFNQNEKEFYFGQPGELDYQWIYM